MRGLPASTLAAALAALFYAGCAEHRPLHEPVVVEVPVRNTTDVDLLFVVDNSYDMGEEQSTMSDQALVLLGELIAPTVTDEGTRPPPVQNLHVGVVSTDLGSGGFEVDGCADSVDGDDGALRNVGQLGGCQPTYSAPDCDRTECPWLLHSVEHPDDGSDPSDPAIWDDFVCIGCLGVHGCGFEQPLEATYRALVENTVIGGSNEGFLRSDSLVVVVFVTDEDDCSARDSALFDPDDDDLDNVNLRCVTEADMLYPVERYRDGLLSLRPHSEDLVVVAAIAGIPVDGTWEVGDPVEELRRYQQVEPPHTYIIGSCATAMGGADPPVRIAELVYSFGDNGVLASICREDWTDALQEIARMIQQHLGTGCVDVPDGVDPAADCRLIEVLDDGTERVVPPTDWVVDTAGESCPGGQLRMMDGSDVPTSARLECFVEP